MEEGCAWLVGIIVAIGLVLAAIYFVLMALGIALAFIGMTVIIPLDFLSSSFTLLGVREPSSGWLILGFFTGATIGLIKGLKVAGRTSDLWKVYLGAGIFALLLALMALAAQPLPAIG